MAGALVATLVLATSASASTSSDVDKHTRAYIDQVRACQTVVAFVQFDIGKGVSDVRLADDATTARNVCQNADDDLATANHDHFDKQANTAYIGVDTLKSGLNAMLAYIDNPRPTKLIEVRNKIQFGNQAARIGIRGINLRRAVYGLKRY